MAAQASAVESTSGESHHPAEPTPQTTLAGGMEETKTSTPRYWCGLCQVDCQSATSLYGHQLGRKHRNRANLPTLMQAEIWRAQLSCQANLPKLEPAKPLAQPKETIEGPNLPTHRNRDNLPTLTKAEIWRAQLCQTNPPKLEPAKPLAQPKETIEGPAFSDAFLDNVDLSRVDDTERMQQREYEDAVVELALYNYASYHKIMEPGEVTFAQVRATSAGIVGWAAACLGGNTTSGTTTTTEVTAAAKTPPTTIVHSDEEEARQLQTALLESMGARPPAAARPQMGAVGNLYYYRRDTDSDDDSEEDGDDNDTTTYEYEEESDDNDNDASEEEKEDCSSRDGESSTSAWSLVSHTSSSYAMPDLAEFSETTALGSL